MNLDVLNAGLRGAWAQSESYRRDLLATLDRVPADQWSAQPDPGRWSVAQQAEHLLLAEIGTSKMARRLIRGDFEGLARPAGAVLHGSTLAAYPYRPLAAPAGLEPRGLPAGEAFAGLAAAHARFFEELRQFRGDDPDALASPDPATDQWFTLAGWVRLQALHEAHHLDQIKRPRTR